MVQTFEVQQQSYNDPFVSLQHGFRSLHAGLSHQWAKGSGVRVAVIDTGMDSQHPELTECTEDIQNFVDNDEMQFRSDVHGTAVAGIIAAVGNNEQGMVGMAPAAHILGLKACWQTSATGDQAICNSLTFTKALDFAISKSVDIINLSLTGPTDPILRRLVERALTENIIVVGAKPTHNNPAFPISIDGTIAVTLPTTHSEFVSAAGRKVLSIQPDNQYNIFTGSSFSTAHIAGLAALVRELDPTLSPAGLLALLDDTAEATTGAVNACKAIASLAGRVSSDCP